MGRRKTHAPLNVLINNRQAGRLEKEVGGAIAFQYTREWLDWPNRFPISLSLPLQAPAWRGEPVVAVFDNLHPDSISVRKRVAEKTGAQGTDYRRHPCGWLQQFGPPEPGLSKHVRDDPFGFSRRVRSGPNGRADRGALTPTR